MILPKLWICYRGDGNVSLSFNNTARTQQSGAGETGSRYISGLGDVSHVDRNALSSTKRSTNEDIASDDFTENEKASGKSLVPGDIDSGNANESGVDSKPRLDKRVSFPDDGSAGGE